MIVGTGRQTYDSDHAFNRRRELPFHTLELTYSGTMLRRTGARGRFRPQPNYTLLLTPPYTPYALRGRERGEEIWVMFGLKPEFAERLDWSAGDFGIPELAVPSSPFGRQVIDAFEDVHRHMSGRPARRERLAENALERLLLLAEQLRGTPGAALDSRVRRALDIIENRYATPLSVDRLAEAVNLSPSHFAHLFRRETGDSPIRCVEAVRLERARLLLLRTDRRIREIAADVGFEDPYYFSTRFARRYGRSPSAWRRRPTSPE